MGQKLINAVGSKTANTEVRHGTSEQRRLASGDAVTPGTVVQPGNFVVAASVQRIGDRPFVLMFVTTDIDVLRWFPA